MHTTTPPTMSLSWRLPAAIMSGVLAFTGPIWGQTTEDYKLLANDGGVGNQFGYSTAISNGIIAVGARQDDDNGAASGSAYLFDASSGAQLVKLLPSDGSAGDEFGFSIAISDDLVLVGARFDGDNGPQSGSAYLFDASTGAQLAKLLPTDGAGGDEFGFAVAIDEGIAAIGAKRDDDNGPDSGSLYLFDISTGAQITKLLPDDGAANDNFGESVDIDNGVLAVGAHGDGDNGPLSGSAYLFDAASGTQLAKLLPTDGGTNDFFGTTIAIDDGVVAVGAWADSIFFDHSGSAYLFDASSGSQIAKLVPNDGHDRDHFGIAVAIDAGIVAIGAEGDDDSGFDAGSAYLFDASSGAEITKILASDGEAFDDFGLSIAVEDGVVVVGAHRDDDSGSSSGSAYVITDTGCVPPQNFCTSAPHSGGLSAVMDWEGSVSVAANDLELRCEGGPASTPGIFFYGPDQLLVSFGDGFRCVGGLVRRLPVVQTDASGFVSLALDLAAAPGVSPGVTQNFQFWFRDPTGPGGNGFNLSDGLEVTFCD